MTIPGIGLAGFQPVLLHIYSPIIPGSPLAFEPSAKKHKTYSQRDLGYVATLNRQDAGKQAVADRAGSVPPSKALSPALSSEEELLQHLAMPGNLWADHM